jgi:hypothetical protein
MFKQVPFFSVCDIHPVLHHRCSGASFVRHIAVCKIAGQVVSIAASEGAVRAVLRTVAAALVRCGRTVERRFVMGAQFVQGVTKCPRRVVTDELTQSK